MRFALLALFSVLSCASVPQEVRKQISTEQLAGYWMEGKQFLKITCEGEVEFKVREPSSIFRSEPYSQNQGKIKRIADGKLSYRSWAGFDSHIEFTKPERLKDGCTQVVFDGMILKGGQPVDCTKDNNDTLVQLISRAYNAKPDPCYQ